MLNRLIYRWGELKQHVIRFRNWIIERLFQKWVLQNKSYIQFFNSIHQDLQQRKQELLDRLKSHQKVIFVLFRDQHWLDFFFPVNQALLNQFPEQFVVFYIGFSSHLRRVKNRVTFLHYHNQISQRIKKAGLDPAHYFSSEELSMYRNFPKANLSLTTEGIRQETFEIGHRVYIPHYFVLKSKDKLPKNIRYNHVFLPSKPPYSYPSMDKATGVEFHEVGYPKICNSIAGGNLIFQNNNPVVVYAPTLEVSMLMDTLNKGIMEIFAGMSGINVLVKLHPSLGSRLHPIRELFEKHVSQMTNAVLDTNSNLLDVAVNSSLLITDFGSVGAEYRTCFGKRVIYLQVPEWCEGGSDLLFRDHFADKISSIKDLKSNIETVLKMGDLSEFEIEDMRNKVLYNPQTSDIAAATAIAKILDVQSGMSLKLSS